MGFWEEEFLTHCQDDLIQLEGHEYHIHKTDIEEGRIPLELTVFQSLLEILGIDSEALTDEQILLSCEKINDLMVDMLEIGQFQDDENT